MDIKTPQLWNVKAADELLNVSMLLPYPDDTPFGNLQRAQVEFISRIDYINSRLVCLYQTYARGAHVQGFVPQKIQWLRLEIEEVVYWLRKSVDTLICLTSVLASHRAHGDYPKRIPVDCIGAALDRLTRARIPLAVEVFRGHRDALWILNAISNTYKHHFVNYETVSIIGADGPVAFYVTMERNDTQNEPELKGVRVSELVESCSGIFKDVRERHHDWLVDRE